MKRPHFIWLGVSLLFLGGAGTTYAQSPTNVACEPLPPPSGNVVNVDSVSTLQNAVNNASAGDTILIADGVYNLDGA